MTPEERLALINKTAQTILDMPDAERQAYQQKYWQAINDMLAEYNQIKASQKQQQMEARNRGDSLADMYRDANGNVIWVHNDWSQVILEAAPVKKTPRRRKNPPKDREVKETIIEETTPIEVDIEKPELTWYKTEDPRYAKYKTEDPRYTKYKTEVPTPSNKWDSTWDDSWSSNFWKAVWIWIPTGIIWWTLWYTLYNDKMRVKNWALPEPGNSSFKLNEPIVTPQTRAAADQVKNVKTVWQWTQVNNFWGWKYSSHSNGFTNIPKTYQIGDTVINADDIKAPEPANETSKVIKNTAGEWAKKGVKKVNSKTTKTIAKWAKNIAKKIIKKKLPKPLQPLFYL